MDVLNQARYALIKKCFHGCWSVFLILVCSFFGMARYHSCLVKALTNCFLFKNGTIKSNKDSADISSDTSRKPKNRSKTIQSLFTNLNFMSELYLVFCLLNKIKKNNVELLVCCLDVNQL